MKGFQTTTTVTTTTTVVTLKVTVTKASVTTMPYQHLKMPNLFHKRMLPLRYRMPKQLQWHVLKHIYLLKPKIIKQR